MNGRSAVPEMERVLFRERNWIDSSLFADFEFLNSRCAPIKMSRELEGSNRIQVREKCGSLFFFYLLYCAF